MKNIALILAAGNGSRMQSELPKQYLPLDIANRTALDYTLKAFSKHPKIDGIYTIINSEHELYYNKLFADSGLVTKVIHGGTTRQESVRLGLEAISGEGDIQNVLIHDAARPFISKELIDRVLDKLKSYKAVDVGLPISDTIKAYVGGNTLDRDSIYRTQTPQGFHFDTIYNLHKNNAANKVFTDDISLCIDQNIPYSVVEGSVSNIKLTYAQDMDFACKLIEQNSQIRTGLGFDVHKYNKEDPSEENAIPLCGVLVSSPYRVMAHSDGDVALHALVDAMLGTIAAGDIGTHFPPTNEKWKNCNSEVFVKHALKLLEKQNTFINNVDITIICQKPIVSPFASLMRFNVAELLKISENQVNIKATTTERLGFLGREEGIAAQAICCATKYTEVP